MTQREITDRLIERRKARKEVARQKWERLWRQRLAEQFEEVRRDLLEAQAEIAQRRWVTLEIPKPLPEEVQPSPLAGFVQRLKQRWSV